MGCCLPSAWVVRPQKKRYSTQQLFLESFEAGFLPALFFFGQDNLLESVSSQK